MPACKCGVCPACKAKKNPNMKRNQTVADRKKNSLGKIRSKKK